MAEMMDARCLKQLSTICRLMQHNPAPAHIIVAIAALSLLGACQGSRLTGPAGDITISTRKNPRSVIVAIAKSAQNCWFKSGDKVFAKYKMASEVNSHVGRPRLLLVPKTNPGGLPLLVIHAEQKANKTAVEAFGPLLQSANGKRIASDVTRWASGNTKCNA